MNKVIKRQTEMLGCELTDWDVEQIKNRYCHLLHNNGEVWIQGVRSAIRAYLA